MFLGSLSKTAGIQLLINAFILSGIDKVRLVIAGNGSEKESLITQVKGNNVGTIEFWDAPMLEVPEIQDKADVLLLSLVKGAAQFALPSKLAAYMFSGKPIIACVDEESDTADAIREANCGWIIPPENTNALSQIMQMVISLPINELRNLGENGFNYAMENYSKSKNLNKILAHIDDIDDIWR